MSAAVIALFDPPPNDKKSIDGMRSADKTSSDLSSSGVSGAAVQKQTLFKQPRYKVDLASNQATCELNYYRLEKMLGVRQSRDQTLAEQCWRFEMGDSLNPSQLNIQLSDRAPYTTTLRLRQTFDTNPTANAAMTVCLYHDANMAEVVAWNGHRRLFGKYEYPNKNMYQRDEKAQHNRFLTEWLEICQAHGRVSIDVSALGFTAK